MYLSLACCFLVVLLAAVALLPKRQDVQKTLITERLSKRALYINLRKQTQRRKHIEKLLSEMGFRAERVEAVKHDVPWKSLSASHKLCVEMIARDRSSQYICVFEDDADLSVNVKKRDVRGLIEQQLATLQARHGHHIEFVKLGACLEFTQVKLCTPNACQSWCTHAYMLTPHMARTLLKAHGHEWLSYHSDAAYMNFVPSPPLIGHWLLHDHTHPGWRGLFFQARQSAWYEAGMSENGYDGL